MPVPPEERKRVLVRSVARTVFERPAPADVEAIARADVTTICERVGCMYTMDSSIRPLSLPAIPVAGVASTAKCPPGDNLAMIKALTLVQPGDVLIVDAKGFTDWCLGGFQLLDYARKRSGLRGIVVNGGYRDVAEARAAGFPVYASGVSPYSGPKRGPGEVNVPVCCGGVVVHPGDVVAASEEGIAVVPRLAVPEIARALAAAAGSPVADPDRIARLVADLAKDFDANAAD